MNDSPLTPNWDSITTRELVSLALIILVALLVRVPGMSESLWFDETWYTRTMFDVPDQLGYLLWKDVHPPVYALTLLAWTDLVGDSEIAVRMPSLVLGLASIILLWFVTRKWLGPIPALLVCALLALSPPHIWYSHENKVNIMLFLFTTYSVWLYWKASDTREKRDWIKATLMMTVALYTHAYAVPIAAAVFSWLAWRAIGDRTLVKPLCYSGLFIAVAIAPMAVLKYVQRDELARGYLRELSPGDLYKLLLVWLPNGNTLRTVSPSGPFSRLAEQPWPYFLLDAFYALLLGRGLWIFGRRARGEGWFKPVVQASQTESARLILLWFTVPVAFTLLGSIITQSFYIERNLLIILPPFLILLATGACIDLPRWTRNSAGSALLALALASTASLHFLKPDTWTVYKPKPDWRAVMHYFADEFQADGTLRVLVTTPSKPYLYYYRRVIQANVPGGEHSEPFMRTVCNAKPEDVIRELKRRNWPSFYLVHNRTWGGCWKTVWEGYSSAPEVDLLEHREFKGMSVYKFSLE